LELGLELGSSIPLHSPLRESDTVLMDKFKMDQVRVSVRISVRVRVRVRVRIT
jgi:hypothetical protein